MGFQTVINNQPAPAEAGDFCGVNPRASVLGGPGQYNAPEDGAVVGRFVWVDPTSGEVAQHYFDGALVGFLHRENNAVITEFLGEAVFAVNKGLPLALFDEGDFWAKFDAGATPGQRVWADPGNGKPIAGGATAPTLDDYTAEAGYGGTVIVGGKFTISVTSNVATISALTGWVEAGDEITSATLGTVTLGARLTGTPGGAGTFTLTHANFTDEAGTAENQTLTVVTTTQGALEVGAVVTQGGNDYTVTALAGGASWEFSEAAAYDDTDTATATTTVLDVTAVTTGPIEIGDTVVSANATAGTEIVSQLTGTPGGVGTYRVNLPNYFTSEAVGSEAVATPWLVNSLAAAGELAKISTWG